MNGKFEHLAQEVGYMKRFYRKMEPIFKHNAENSCFVCFFVTDFDGIVLP